MGGIVLFLFLFFDCKQIYIRTNPRSKLMFVAARDRHTSLLRGASSRDGLTSLIYLFCPHLL